MRAAGTATGSGVPPPSFRQRDVENAREREELSDGLRPFLRGKIERERLREELQRVTIKALMDALESNRAADVRETIKVLADLSGMRATKITVEAGPKHSEEELNAFRLAGKDAVAAQITASVGSAQPDAG